MLQNRFMRTFAAAAIAMFALVANVSATPGGDPGVGPVGTELHGGAMKINDSVTYVAPDGVEQLAVVTAVLGSGPSRCKILDLRVGEATEVRDVRHQWDAGDFEPHWRLGDITRVVMHRNAPPTDEAQPLPPADSTAERTSAPKRKSPARK